jgi:hypothetical protein
LLSSHGIAHGLVSQFGEYKNLVIYSKIFAKFSEIEKTKFTKKKSHFSFVEKND